MLNLNRHNVIASLAALALATAACDKDGDILYTNGPDRAELSSTSSDIVLDKDHLQALALTVYWNENGEISISDPRVAAPASAASNTLQFSASSDFSEVVEDNVESGVYYRQYTCEALNNLVGRLGLEGGVTGTVYLRVKTVLGANIDAKYSDVMTLRITPYFIDMSIGFILDASQNDSGRTLASPASDGVYSGFFGAAAWENWWLREGNNTIWGNDGVTGTPFVMGNSTTGLDIWNFWFPGMSGCYYTVVDTRSNEWSALYIPELKIGGDMDGDMTYDRKTNKWTYTFMAQPGSLNLTISGTGRQYGVATGTDDTAATDTPVAFSGSADALSFGSATQSISVNVAAAGETTLTLDLSDPKAWRLSAEAGGVDPIETVPPVIYLSGVQPDWDFNNFLKLYNEDNRTYGGALEVNSEWGYRIYTEADAWDNYWTMVDGGTAFSGNLVNGGEGNIAAPEPGFYLFDVNMGDLTYHVTPVTKVSFTGVNDDWNLYDMTPTGEPGVYTATFEKKANTPWGVKIIINEDWNLFFGGNGTPGELALYHDGFEGDNDLPDGTHTLTVNLSKGTYSYEN